MIWVMLHPEFTPDMLGLIPGFLDDNDPRSAKEQIHANYISGWNRFEGFKLLDNLSLMYPGDPRLPPMATTALRDEVIIYYPYSWVVILQKDGTYEVARLD
jgi:hypothetical protein